MRYLLLPLLLALAAPAAAQDSVGAQAETPATPVAPDPMAAGRAAALRGDDAEALAHFLRVLAKDPRDLEALTGAGHAALGLDDPDSAIAFYARAEEVAPRNGRVKAGLGSAMVAQRNPRAALRFFDDATDLGVPAADIAADRGLAYDLRGDGKRAQADYRLALADRTDPETVRRLALSQAMSGGREAALATLDPLLRRQDIPAWRARAFVFAITGDPAEAARAAAMVMPRSQAEALGPYLNRIATLKPAQQAAAVHFGYLPSGSTAQAPVVVAAVEPPALTTAPEAKPEPRTTRRKRRTEVAAAVVPARTPIDPPVPPPVPPEPAPEASEPPVVELPAPNAETRTAARRKRPATPSKGISGNSEVDSFALTAAKPAESAAEPVADTPPKKPIAKVEARKKPVAKPKAELDPERHWVQIAGGANLAGFPRVWAKLSREHAALLKKQTPWTSHYRFTNRLMVGPFDSDDDAQDFVNRLAKDDLSAFTVTTAKGEKVEKLATK